MNCLPGNLYLISTIDFIKGKLTSWLVDWPHGGDSLVIF